MAPLPTQRATATFYTGLIVGVSFYATSIKFLAPSVPLPQLLDVGRQTFGHMVWIEAPLAAWLLVRSRGLPRPRAVLALGVALLVALQHAALRPLLDARVEQILNREDPGPSSLHLVYIGIETLKLAALLALAMLPLRRGDGPTGAGTPSPAEAPTA